METFELRLLRCFLGGSREMTAIRQPEVVSAAAIHIHAGNPIGISGSLEEGVREVVLQIERGFYAEALASKWLSLVLGEFPSFSSIGEKGDAANKLYGFMESRITAFLGLESEVASEGYVEEAEQQQRGILLLAFGVAALCAFIQANVTGPTQQKFSAFPAHAAWKDNSLPKEFFEQECESWARLELMIDGCDILGKIALPQYLIMAKLLLVSQAEVIDKIGQPECSRFPRTRSWWAFRVLLMQQRILAERSASLHSLLVSISVECIKRFGTVGGVEQLGWKLPALEVKCMVAAAHLEIGLMEHFYGHDDAARQCFDKAGESCGLQLALTGVLGFRTQYQADPKAQMVLVANSNSAEDETNWLDILDDADKDLQDASAEIKGSEILLTPKLVGANSEGTSVENEKFTGGEQKTLNSIEQVIILARGVDIKKSNPDDELRSWQMAPFIEAVDSQQRSHPMVKAWCQLLRIRWEKTRARTRERCFLMMEQLVNNIREGPLKVAVRISYVFCVPFPILSALLKEYAELMITFGLVGDAMKLFEELELWNNLIDCYCLLGKKAAAAGLIRQRLTIQPDDPRLWCSLGDVTMDDDCYHKAWQVSGHRFTRAQRSLANSAYNRGNYDEAIEHWNLALSLNPLYPDGWFALGSAALKTGDLDKALVAFTRQVQLDPENGESWNNIAAINMQKKKSKEAFVAFREALKFKRNSWQIWENFAQVALDVTNFGQAVLAVEKVFDLSAEKRAEVSLLNRLVEELEVRKGILVLPAVAVHPEYDVECETQELAKGAANDGINEWASMRMGLPSVATTQDRKLFPLAENRNCLPLLDAGCTPAQAKETKALLERVGKLLSRIAGRGLGGGQVWGLKARWHRLVGDLSMCIEALLKQARAHQGSKWQSNPEQFHIFAQACLQLSEAYMEYASSGGERRDLFSAQMLLRNTLKQADHFNSTNDYKDLESCLQRVEEGMQVF